MSAGRLQQRWPYLFCLSVREGRGETSVPVILSQDCHDDDEPRPPQTRPPQEEWRHLYCCRSWTGQELPLTGLYSSAFLLELSGAPPFIKNPGTINNCNCQTTLKSQHEILNLKRKFVYLGQDRAQRHTVSPPQSHQELYR